MTHMPEDRGQQALPTLALQTAGAMVAFAANSLLCRVALRTGAIDPATFATVRIVSGALLLAWLARGSRVPQERTDWIAALSLVIYLVPFTLAYLALDAGTGALLLFGTAQLTMLAVGLCRGERCAPLGWTGIGLALAGFCYLLLPGRTAPPVLGAFAMTIAGIAWGVYSLRGHDSRNAVASTARNFLLAVPCVLLINVIAARQVHVSASGAVLALASGTLASALGYVIWYRALRHLSALAAGTAQLSVPVLALLGGVVLLDEPLSVRLTLSGAAILGGIALIMHERRGALEPR